MEKKKKNKKNEIDEITSASIAGDDRKRDSCQRTAYHETVSCFFTQRPFSFPTMTPEASRRLAKTKIHGSLKDTS